ncbi:hypothetical protein J7T55_015800 [Diaporthe amygdali]|uniref:uncharacterized protein n=1 Tax=Phomopsis amygdali TaxID=1214568 RepID=UPI0022FEFD5B|nr:uncharacterized protein J7T55_015800 [Diaporthe amygdali]KAJ0107334.1 hypothetical protein J7T55_015800 [Diaporthe amygdali]
MGPNTQIYLLLSTSEAFQNHFDKLCGDYTWTAIMASNEKHDLVQVGIANETSTSAISPDIQQDQSLLEKQTRTLRLFSKSQLFAFSLVYLGTGYYVAGNMYFALANGGPAAWVFSYLVVAAGVLCQVAAFSEMASIQPIAGAQYYWTWHFAPQSLKRFLTWIQGWSTWAGYIALLASCLNGNTVILEGLIQLAHPEYKTGGWHTALIMIATVAFCAIINMYAFWLVPWFELLTGFLNVCMVTALFIVLWAMAPRNSADIFMQTNVSSGWGNYFVSANLGALSNIYLFISFESVVHMGEETQNAKSAVPFALFWSTVTNAFMGLVMIITFAMGMPSLDVLLDSASPIVTTLLYATASTKATIVIISGDGGLPQYFGHVDAVQRVPLRAVVLATIIASLLSLLNIGSSTYIAFSAIISLSSLAVYLSYAIVLACLLYARLNGGFKPGPWNLGRAGSIVNMLGLVYTVYIMVWLPFPNYLPVTAANMNYCGPVFGLIIIGVVSLWFIRGREHWKGPNRAVVEIVLGEED